MSTTPDLQVSSGIKPMGKLSEGSLKDVRVYFFYKKRRE